MATETEIKALAGALRIDPAAIRGYSNLEQGKLPQSIQSLEDFGNNPNNNAYGIRRRQANGAWTPIRPGPNPNAAAGTPYPNISNCEDTCNTYPFPDPVGLGAAILAGDSRWVAAFNDRVNGFPYGGFKDAPPAPGAPPASAGQSSPAAPPAAGAHPGSSTTSSGVLRSLGIPIDDMWGAVGAAGVALAVMRR